MSWLPHPALTGALSVSMATPHPALASMKAVPRLDLSRFLGRWHEIARLPSPRQQPTDRGITLTFSECNAAGMRMERLSQPSEGAQRTQVAMARRRYPVEEPGQFQCTSSPRWLRWWSGAWADLWILALAPDYQWMMLGDPERNGLWLLAREPTMERNVLEMLKARARGLGYDLAPLIISGQLRSFQPV